MQDAYRIHSNEEDETLITATQEMYDKECYYQVRGLAELHGNVNIRAWTNKNAIR